MRRLCLKALPDRSPPGPIQDSVEFALIFTLTLLGLRLQLNPAGLEETVRVTVRLAGAVSVIVVVRFVFAFVVRLMLPTDIVKSGLVVGMLVWVALISSDPLA